MHSLIYASTAEKAYSETELLLLLNEARLVNARLAITGMLLYSPGTKTEKGTFVQVLEGYEGDVGRLYQGIRGDMRHKDCTLITEEPLFVRRFGDWTMGFRDLSTLRPSEVPGFSSIFLQNWTLRQILAEPDPVLRLLYSFAGTRMGE